MKNKKTLIMSIIIALLLIIIVILSLFLVKSSKENNKNQSSDVTEASSDTADTRAEEKNQTEEEKITEEKATEGKTNQTNDTLGYKVEISQASSWENGDKKCATENVTIYNNTQTGVKDWKLDIIYNADVTIDNIWSGEKKISGSILTITPVDYNTEIPAKGNVNFGYNISISDLTISDYILYIDGNEYRKADLEVQKEEEKTTEETADTSETANLENGTPVSNHGKLSVKETEIVDKEGKTYQLKGCSTHGITWFPDYVNSEAFKTFRDEWGANLIRLAMYTDTGDSYGYCSGGDKKEILELVDKGVNAATELGMYVIVDWHILNDNNPNTHIEDSKEFFETVSEKYKDYENVLYEICNEPNGGTSWQEVKEYAETIIPIIREHDKDAIIIVGTPTWSQDVDVAAKDPIMGYDNIMYAVHFYAATHKQEIRNKVEAALDAGLPIFVSEFSICDASGNGAIDYEEAEKWFELISDNNLSYASWNISNKEETSALIKSSCNKTSSWSDEELSEAGQYIKEKISGR